MADRTELFSTTRSVIPQNFAADLKRLLEDPDNVGITPSPISPPVSLDETTIPTGLPSNAGRGSRVKIPRFVTVEGGKRFGIQVQSDEITTGTDVVDAALLSDLMQAIKELGYVVFITDAFRPPAEARRQKSGLGSRHAKGQALDIGAVNGIRASLDHPDYPNNQEAIRLVQWFIQHGYTAGRERGADRSVLFGNHSFGWNRTGIDHHHHIHIGIR